MGCTKSSEDAEVRPLPVPSALRSQRTLLGKSPNKRSVRFENEGFEFQGSTKLKILHFNDVYNIEENPKKQFKGGAARFVSAVK